MHRKSTRLSGFNGPGTKGENGRVKENSGDILGVWVGNPTPYTTTIFLFSLTTWVLSTQSGTEKCDLQSLLT